MTLILRRILRLPPLDLPGSGLLKKPTRPETPPETPPPSVGMLDVDGAPMLDADGLALKDAA